MSIEVQFEVEQGHKLNRKHASTLASTTTSEEYSAMEQKLASLESQYVQMAMEYQKRIKELKITLAEKGKRQVTLVSEIANLREDFKSHQEQIAHVGQKLAHETKEDSLRMTKKNSSPELIKKTLETDKKYQKKQSPSNHVVNSNSKNQLKLFGQLKKKDCNQNSSPAIKRRSPRANPNGILHILKQEPLHHVPLLQKKDSEGQMYNSGKRYIQPTSGEKKKAYSPKNTQEVNPVLNANSAKYLKKSEPLANAGTNPSPKRSIRRSPGLKTAPKIEPTKASKHLLGKLKETTADIEQAF